jgi:bacteriocin-like protein
VKDKNDYYSTNQTDHTKSADPDRKDTVNSETTSADELSDTELEQVSGGGDGGSTWIP